MDSDLAIIQKTYELYKHLSTVNGTIARMHRYSLGEKTLTCSLNLLEHLITAKHAPKSYKSTYLLRANTCLEVIRFQLRLYLDLKLVNETKVFQMQALVREIGRMLGGWLKSIS